MSRNILGPLGPRSTYRQIDDQTETSREHAAQEGIEIERVSSPGHSSSSLLVIRFADVPRSQQVPVMSKSNPGFDAEPECPYWHRCRI